MANTIEHPTDVYLLESAEMPALDGWLAGMFEPEALPYTVGALFRAQPIKASDPRAEEAARVIADGDAKPDRYRAALEAGTDPVMIAAWTAEGQACKAQVLATTRLDSGTGRLSEQEIQAVIAALGSVRSVLARAHPDDKAAVLRQLGLKLIYKPEHALVSAEIDINPTSGDNASRHEPDGSITELDSDETNHHDQLRSAAAVLDACVADRGSGSLPAPGRAAGS